jgi:hypothetical protein
MSVYKRCSRARLLDDGAPNRWFWETSPRCERSQILDGRHGIRRQPDITFKAFAEIYLRDHADLHKKSANRDREILTTLNRFFGSAILHEITSHRIEQFKRDRLNGTWRAFKQKRAAKPVKPATVNRELDTLKSILSKAVERRIAALDTFNLSTKCPQRGTAKKGSRSCLSC